MKLDHWANGSAQFPLSAQFDHQAACLADQTAEHSSADNVGASRTQRNQHASGSAQARKEQGAKLHPFRPTNPPVPSRTAVSVGGAKEKSKTAHQHRDSTAEVVSSPPSRAARDSSARVTRSTRKRQSRQAVPEVIAVDDDDDEIEEGADSDLEVVPRNRLTRKEKGKERQRDDSPPPGSIFISKLPAAIKQGCKYLYAAGRHRSANLLPFSARLPNAETRQSGQGVARP